VMPNRFSLNFAVASLKFFDFYHIIVYSMQLKMSEELQNVTIINMLVEMVGLWKTRYPCGKKVWQL
jgi:hypothetical protein